MERIEVHAMTAFAQVQKFTLTLLLSLGVVGCSQMSTRRPSVAAAPALSGDSAAHIRGVSDPNAQFTLTDRTRSSSPTPLATGEIAAKACAISSLQVYEVGASMSGDNRVIRLALKNRSDIACNLSGNPAIELQDERGQALEAIHVYQIGITSLSGTVTSSAVPSAMSVPISVVLGPASTATFEIGWSGGEGCPLVSRFMVSVPGTEAGEDQPGLTGRFPINHPFNVCNGEVRVSALINGGST